MTYKLTSGWPIRVLDGAFVNPETNQEYLAWIAEGNTPEPADEPLPPAPLEQIRALEQQYADAQAKVNRNIALKVLLDEAMAYPEAEGLTREQVHAVLLANPESAYTKLFNLEQQIEALRAQL